MVSVQLYQ
jgi:hypothetical protein